MSCWLRLIADPTEVEVIDLRVAFPMVESLLPVALVCGISILLTALWLFAVYEYTWLKRRETGR